MESIDAVLPTVTGPRWPGVRYFCTTRQGGVSAAPRDSLNLGLRAGDDPAAVSENRRRLRAMLPAEPLWLHQVHGNTVVDADALPGQPQAGAPDSEPKADAAVTVRTGCVLAIMAADCLPVVMTDEQGSVLGAAHAGWRGLAAGVLDNTLAALRQRRPDARAWRAWIGPGIGPDAFEVGRDVLDVFAGEGAAGRTLFRPLPGRPGKWLADLPALAELRLRGLGVREIHRCGLCTVADPARFYSYRRDGATGRMAMVAWLEAPARG
jgi:YfiH family protein